MLQNKKIILASSSRTRLNLLRSVGLEFEISVPNINEYKISYDAQQQGIKADIIAKILAEEKFKSIADKNCDYIIIAADQILESNLGLLHKPKSYDDAFDQLWSLRDKYHYLHSAFAIGHYHHTPYIGVETAQIKMRNYSEQCLHEYLRLSEPFYLDSVGGYQIEKHGMLLIENIVGDFTTIMGLPMLSLLSELRRLKIICE